MAAYFQFLEGFLYIYNPVSYVYFLIATALFFLSFVLK